MTHWGFVRALISLAGLSLLLLSCASSSSEPHARIPLITPAGAQHELAVGELRGTMFLADRHRMASEPRLLLHFNGARAIPFVAAASCSQPTVAISFHLGAGSRRYEGPFTDRPAEIVFGELLDEATRIARSSSPTFKHFSRIEITSFSAGYGAVRALLRSSVKLRIDSILLLDGLHTSYADAAGSVRALDETAMWPFLDFAKRAAEGQVSFVITTSSIVPPNYASTTETAKWLLARIGVSERTLRRRLFGMDGIAEARSGSFRVYRFAGDAAVDHIDHFHALPAIRCEMLGRSLRGRKRQARG